MNENRNRRPVPGRWLKVCVGLGIVALAFFGCAGAPETSVLRMSDAAPAEQLVWVGTGTSWRYEGDEWVRTPEQDYEFLVRQNRYAERWESLKIQNRTSPAYDGAAGAADQQHFFLIEYDEPTADDNLPVVLHSTYGNGDGTSDRQYRHAALEIAADVSRFAPYNTIRIDQHYDYEAGVLSETVLLLKVSDGGEEEPFVRIDEQARIFRPTQGRE